MRRTVPCASRKSQAECGVGRLPKCMWDAALGVCYNVNSPPKPTVGRGKPPVAGDGPEDCEVPSCHSKKEMMALMLSKGGKKTKLAAAGLC